MQIIALRQRLESHPGTVVLRDIDFSRACQFWLTPFTSKELELWWTNQETFWRSSEDLDEVFRIFDEVPPPSRKYGIPGVFLDAETEEEIALWVEMSESKTFYSCTICCDGDSVLQRPDRTRIVHKGFNCGSEMRQ